MLGIASVYLYNRLRYVATLGSLCRHEGQWGEGDEMNAREMANVDATVGEQGRMTEKGQVNNRQ